MILPIRHKIIIISIFWLNLSFTQESNNQNVPNNNYLTVKYGIYTFYDGMPIAHRSEYTDKIRLSKGFGLRYLHRVDHKNAWSLSTYLYYYDLEKSKIGFQPGVIEYKNFVTGQGSYYRTLLTSNSTILYASIGLMFRGGFEWVHGGFYGGEAGGGDAYTVTHNMLDVGIPIGLHYFYFFGKHFHLVAGLEHTFFPYVYDSKRNMDFSYDWDNGTSRNMTKLYFGLGFNF